MSHHVRKARGSAIAYRCHCGGGGNRRRGKVNLTRMFKKAKTHRTEKRNSVSALRLFEAFVVLCGVLLCSYALVVGFSGTNETTPEPNTLAPAESQDKDYSHFTHTNQFHSRLPCLLCHRRDDNSARITFPGKINHLPCAGCHALQFSDNHKSDLHDLSYKHGDEKVSRPAKFWIQI